MLDEIFAMASQLRKPVFDDKYTADQAIISAELIEISGSDRLVVVFSPWHVPKKAFHRFISTKLAATGANVLTYYFNQQILSNDPLSVKSSFEYIALSISEDVRNLCASKGYQRIDLFGISLGNVALCLTADVMDDFDVVTMLVPGSELAAPLWNGWRTRRLRNTLTKEHLRLEDLQKEWDLLAPEVHVGALKGHSVHIVLAKNDHFIPYAYGRKLADNLSQDNSKVSVITNPYGHLQAILSYQPGKAG